MPAADTEQDGLCNNTLLGWVFLTEKHGSQNHIENTNLLDLILSEIQPIVYPLIHHGLIPVESCPIPWVNNSIFSNQNR